jgi:hypothetical protein
MSHYMIDISPDEVSREYDVMLRGPGIDPGGRRYVFASTNRCATFVEAVNFAYEQGLRDGLRRGRMDDNRLLVVTGSTPENMAIRLESWWSGWKRRWMGVG